MQVTGRVSRDLHIKIEIKSVDFSLFNKMLLGGTYISDQQEDTLLYAGQLKVNITDWFFIKDKADLNYIGLEDAVIKLQRKDSVWNYQFLADYFSSPDTSKKKKGIEFNLKRINLQHITIKKIDSWKGENMTARISLLNIDAQQIEPAKKRINIETIKIIDPEFAIYNYPGRKPKNPDVPAPAGQAVDSSGNSWDISVKKIQLVNGVFRNDKLTDRVPNEYFDGQHILFSAINGTLSNIRLHKDTLVVDTKLSTREKSGLEVKQFISQMKIHKSGWEFHDLDIVTNKSHLKHFFAMRFENFNDDMAAFVSNVYLEGDFSESEVNSDDIAYFAPALQSWKKSILLTGNIAGTIENLKGKQLEIRTGRNTYFKGDAALTGLPDIRQTFIDVKATDFRSVYADAVDIFPTLRNVKTPKLAPLQYVKFNGQFTGFIRDFVTYGTIQTSLGTVQSDLNMKFPPGKISVYSGKLKTENFDLGTFLNNSAIGYIAFDGSLKGRGFNFDNLYAELNGHFSKAEIFDYTYSDANIIGTFDKKLFNGKFSINDPNLGADISGIIDLQKDTPAFNFTGHILHLQAKELGWTKNDIALSSTVNVDFSGRNIDAFLGSARLTNVALTNNDQRLSFDSLILKSLVINDKKYLSLTSNEFTASMTGSFKIMALPSTVLTFLHNYYPNYIPPPRQDVSEQDFSFEIKTRNIDQFTRLLNALNIPLSGFDNSALSGTFSLAGNKMNLDAVIPSFGVKNINFRNLELNAEGNTSKLSLKGKLDELVFNDSLRFPNTDFSVESSNDFSTVQISTKASKALQDADIKAEVETRKEGVLVKFKPSMLVISDENWTINEDGEIYFGKKYITSEGIRLTSGVREIRVYTRPSGIGNYNDIVADLNNVHIEEFAPYFIKSPKMEGNVSGQIEIMDPFNRMHMEATITADHFRFENDSIGKLKTFVTWSSSNGDVTYNIVSDNENYDFTIDGIFRTKDSTGKQINAVVNLENSSIHLLQNYIGNIMSEIDGKASGNIHVTGPGSSPELEGAVIVRDANFKVNYTQCSYRFTEEEINFRKGEIDFGKILLKDVYGHIGQFSGKLYHSFFKQMAFNMFFQTDSVPDYLRRKGMLLLNTSRRDNSVFFGRVVARGEGSLTGPINNMQLRMKGEPTDSSVLSLITGDSRVTGQSDYVVFRQYGKEMKPVVNIRESSNLTIDMDITANSKARVNVVLDETTNDVLQARGRGNFNLHTGTSEKTTLFGSYEIESGKYAFKFQSLLKRDFELSRGTIRWSGDPYNADIDVDASYLAKDINLSSLVGSSYTTKITSDVNIICHLKNTLQNPSISFEFEVLSDEATKSIPVMLAINQLQDNPNEMNKQVASLLLFNTFIQNQQSFVTGASVPSFFSSTLSQFLSQQLSTSLSSFVKKIFKDPTLDVTVVINPSFSTIGTVDQLETGGQGIVGITKQILNGRVIIKAGGIYNYDNQVLQSANTFYPDFSLEWLITPDGKLRISGFYKNNFSFEKGPYNRAGGSISYNRDFDMFSEVLGSKKEKKN